MPAHGVTRDRLAFHIYFELIFDQCGEFVSQIAPHFVVRRPWGLGRVHIKPCTLAKVISFIIGHGFPARGSVRED